MIDSRLTSTVSGNSSRSVTDLLQDTATHTENVVRGEIRLAVVRVQDQVSVQLKRAMFVVVGGALGLVALVALLVAGIMWLSSFMESWLATAIVGAVVGIGAAALLFMPARANGAES